MPLYDQDENQELDFDRDEPSLYGELSDDDSESLRTAFRMEHRW